MSASNSRRDADGDHEHVIEHQGGGGEQPGDGAEVFLGDRVRAAAMRIRGNGLAVGEIDDEEQDDDEGTDRPDVGKAGRAERDEQGERRLRTVRRRAEGVEAEHGDAGDDADALFAFLVGGQASAEKPVGERHRPCSAKPKA